MARTRARTAEPVTSCQLASGPMVQLSVTREMQAPEALAIAIHGALSSRLSGLRSHMGSIMGRRRLGFNEGYIYEL